MKNIHITIFFFSLISIATFSCKKVEEIVKDVLSEKERLLMAEEWLIDWDKTYKSPSASATFIKASLQLLGTGRIKFESNKDLNYYAVGSLVKKKLGVWELTPVVDQLKITGSDQTGVTSAIPTSGESLFFSMIQNSTVKSVTATELILTPGIGATILGLGSTVTLYFKAAN